MALVDHNQDTTVDFPWKKVFEALKTAIPTIKGMQVEKANEITKTISIKAGVSLFSWGENITVSLEEIGQEKTKISILSTPKTGAMLGGAMDMGKNRKNINLILDAMSELLA